jgi:flagellar hook-basal body complex protein FliE
MATDPISFLPAVQQIATDPATSLASQPTSNFESWLTGAIAQVNTDLLRADDGMQRLATGEASDLHHVMIALEEARIGVQLLVQVRNRLLDAYQDVVRMQI